MEEKDIQERQVRRDLVRNLTDNWDEHVAFEAAVSRLKRMKFEQLLKAGFTEEQALILVKS